MISQERIKVKKTTSKNLGLFSFFTGAGFLDLGFESVGFRTYMANELDRNFSEVYRFSRRKMRRPLPVFGLQEGDVCSYLVGNPNSEYLTQKIADARREMDLVGFIGGPPCPDFSVAGKQAGAKGKHGRLSQVYIDMICEQNPDFFVFENVKGLLSTAKHRAFFNQVIRTVHKHGYATTYRLINALEYGAAQDRERVILVGIKLSICSKHVDGKTGEILDFPWDDFVEYPMEKVRNVKWPTTDIFLEDGKLEAPKGIIKPLSIQYWFEKNDVENHANANDYFLPRAGLRKMQTFAEGDDSRKCFKRPHRWRYSPTAAYGNNEVHLHPYKARRLSVAETLAIQSLPKTFELPSDIPLSAKFKTIGNGVPFVAARGVAETLKKFLEEL